MLFNSIVFFIFLPICFGLYWFVCNKRLHIQNILILIASYVFYGWWDERFLALIALSTLVDYTVGLQLEKAEKQNKRKLLLAISLAINLGLLGVFKYYNFFVASWIDAWASFGVSMEASTLKIILPVGISFYTFQTLSYTIDIYRKQLQAERNLINFASYVAFFPQLVAGPIERATRLLPQFSRKRIFDYHQAKSGVYLIIWGLFKKIVIADNCAFFVNTIFENPSGYSSAELLVGAVLFAFQIYGDFSGYSDIAIGTARLFGFELMVNFKFPYFSKNIGDFWRRWHISLSTWFRDYVYIPLGGSRGSRWQQIRNVFVIFLVSGFWHGANWTFIVWGAIHALLFIPLLLLNRNRNDVNSTRISFKDSWRILLTFLLVTLAWIYFRADTITIANQYILDIVQGASFELSLFIQSNKYMLYTLICFFGIGVLLIKELKSYVQGVKEVQLTKWSAFFMIMCILFLGAFQNPETFIYFQF